MRTNPIKKEPNEISRKLYIIHNVCVLQTKEILNTVDELLQDIPDMKFTSDVFRLSKIDRIRGKVRST